MCVRIYAPTSRWPQRYVCMYVGTYLVSLTHPFAHSSLSITPNRVGTFEKAKPDSQTYMLSVYIPPPPCSQGWKALFVAMYSLIIIRSPNGFFLYAHLLPSISHNNYGIDLDQCEHAWPGLNHVINMALA